MAQSTPSQLEILLRVADIRDLAGVGTSAVVTNWRARSPKFPEPRVGGSQPLFELHEVLDRLRGGGIVEAPLAHAQARDVAQQLEAIARAGGAQPALTYLRDTAPGARQV